MQLGANKQVQANVLRKSEIRPRLQEQNTRVQANSDTESQEWGWGMATAKIDVLLGHVLRRKVTEEQPAEPACSSSVPLRPLSGRRGWLPGRDCKKY